MLKNLVYFSIFTTFVVLVWISLTIYHSFTSSTITQDVNIQITPLNPTFNIGVISGLSAREKLSVDLSSNLSTSSAKMSVQGAPIPIIQTGTASATLVPAPSGGTTPSTSGKPEPNL